MLSWVVRLCALGTLGLLVALGASMLLGAALAGPQLAYDSARSGGEEIYLLDVQRGLSVRLTSSSGMNIGPAWSPDGQHIAYLSLVLGAGESWVMRMRWDGADVQRLAPIRLNGWNNTPLAWSPDGRHIAYTTVDESGTQGIYLMNADGSGQVRLIEPNGSTFSPTWSPSGRLAFAWSPVANTEIYVLDPALVKVRDSHTPTPRPQRITDNYYTDTAPAWSPDGAWIAFVSDRAGSSDIYLMRPDGAELHALTQSTARDGTPAWSPDGRLLAFSSTAGGVQTLYLTDLAGSAPRPLLAVPHQDSRPAWRPTRNTRSTVHEDAPDA